MGQMFLVAAGLMLLVAAAILLGMHRGLRAAVDRPPINPDQSRDIPPQAESESLK
jgi:hypothetical protein